MKNFKIPRTIWPVEWGKKNKMYFYLETIEDAGSSVVQVQNRGEMIMLSSYSYLGLLGHPRINESAKKAIDDFCTGTHGVRLLAGTTSLHVELEEKIAQFKNAEASIVYSSGYVANISIISTLLRREDVVFCDKLNHASIMDGCKLSGARCLRFRHNDMNHLEYFLKNVETKGNKLVVVDAVFSMDGDIVNLPEIIKLCKKYGAILMVDEAHSLGMLGQTGKGIEEHFGLNPDSIDLKMGTLSKTIPSMGGYVAGNFEIINMLKHNSRGFIYSAALAPPLVAAALTSFRIISEEPERVRTLKANMHYFRNNLKKRGFNTLKTETAIIPIVCGENNKAWEMASYCQDKGLFIQGIPSPVVPKGTSRLRAIVTAAHSQKEIEYSLNVIEEAGLRVGII